jgi:hypothetical protein
MNFDEPSSLVVLVFAVIGVLAIVLAPVLLMKMKKSRSDSFMEWLYNFNQTIGMPLWEFILKSTPKWFAFLGWLIILSILIILFWSSELILSKVVSGALILCSSTLVLLYIMVSLVRFIRKCFGGAINKITVAVILSLVTTVLAIFLYWLTFEIASQLAHITAPK